MSLEQLIGRCVRLKGELSIALSTLPRNAGRIDRLRTDIASAENAVRASRGADAVVMHATSNAAVPLELDSRRAA